MCSLRWVSAVRRAEPAGKMRVVAAKCSGDTPRQGEWPFDSAPASEHFTPGVGPCASSGGDQDRGRAEPSYGPGFWPRPERLTKGAPWWVWFIVG